MAVAEQTTARGYCRGCEAHATQRFDGWATADGRENGVRPRAFYRQCRSCGTRVLVLGNVHDADGLCRTVLRDWLKRIATGARVAPTGPPTADGRLDAGDALGWLSERIWELYGKWDPTRNPSFTSHASHFLSLGIRQWAADESGETNERRLVPKAHAASVSTSMAAMEEAAGGADQLDLGSSDFTGGRLEISEALKWAPLNTRKLVLLLHCGYSQTEAAGRLGISTSRATVLLADLRQDIVAGE